MKKKKRVGALLCALALTITPMTAVAATGDYGYVNANGVNFRCSPSMQSPVYCLVNKPDRLLELNGSTGGWIFCKMLSGNGVYYTGGGYIAYQYVTYYYHQ